VLCVTLRNKLANLFGALTTGLESVDLFGTIVLRSR
jgi:hypothetical protein